jgi:hypothetical protein
LRKSHIIYIYIYEKHTSWDKFFVGFDGQGIPSVGRPHKNLFDIAEIRAYNKIQGGLVPPSPPRCGDPDGHPSQNKVIGYLRIDPQTTVSRLVLADGSLLFSYSSGTCSKFGTSPI